MAHDIEGVERPDITDLSKALGLLEEAKVKLGQAAHIAPYPFRHCNRADRAEALLASNEIHFTDGTSCWCDPIIEDFRIDGIHKSIGEPDA